MKEILNVMIAIILAACTGETAVVVDSGPATEWVGESCEDGGGRLDFGGGCCHRCIDIGGECVNCQ